MAWQWQGTTERDATNRRDATGIIWGRGKHKKVLPEFPGSGGRVTSSCRTATLSETRSTRCGMNATLSSTRSTLSRTRSTLSEPRANGDGRRAHRCFRGANPFSQAGTMPSKARRVPRSRRRWRRNDWKPCGGMPHGTVVRSRTRPTLSASHPSASSRDNCLFLPHRSG